MGKLLPILKPTGYGADEPLFFKEQLFDSSTSPIIAFGTDDGNRILYQGAANEDDYQQKFPALKKEALTNLKEIQPAIEVKDTQGTKIAFVEGHEYSSEKILDSDFMIQVGQAIGSNSLMVGIPFKNCLIAIDSNSEIRLKFPTIIEKYYNNPQQDPISGNIFLVNDGEIVAMAGGDLNDESEDDKFTIIENTKTNNYKVELRSKTIDELTENVNTSFQQVISMIMQRKVFGGKISYYLDGEMKLDKILIEKCQSYITQIDENEMAQELIQALTDTKISLLFYYRNKVIAPANNISTRKQDKKLESSEKKWWQFWK